MNSNSSTIVFRQLQHLLAYSALAFCSPMVTSRKKILNYSQPILPRKKNAIIFLLIVS
jgi:hypothetical protein